jgi:2-amino-4-hydroxy-6-hydroxymethyldihydropteridine diphosphokinase
MSWQHSAYIGVGSNLGDRFEFIKSALVKINALSDTSIVKISLIYESYPLGGVSQHNFLNSVVKILTTKEPEELFISLKEIEEELGRKIGKRWDSREIDLDILFYDKIIYKKNELIIPHPSLHERDFVLLPLCELEPALIHPVFNQKICDICNNNLNKFVFAVCKKKLIISEGEILEVENGN